MADERVTELAREIASLIPEPPAAHDPFGYLAWEEIVLGAATRLGALGSDRRSAESLQGLLHISCVTGRLDAEALTTLAMVVQDAGTAAGEPLLQMSVDAWRHRTRSVEPVLARHV